MTLFAYTKIGKAVPRGHWHNIDNRKAFFLQLANALGFDPNVPDNWTKVTKEHVIANNVSYLFPPHIVLIHCDK